MRNVVALSFRVCLSLAAGIYNFASSSVACYKTSTLSVHLKRTGITPQNRGVFYFSRLSSSTTSAMPPTCYHKRKMCVSCGTCPLCPQCLCNGVKRGRGRPRKAAAALRQPNFHQDGFGDDSGESDGDPAYEPRSEATPSSGGGGTAAVVKSVTSRRLREQLPVATGGVKKCHMFTDIERKALDKVMTRVLHQAAKILVPGDALKYVDIYKQSWRADAGVQDRVVEGILTASRGSVEKRVLRGVLCTSLPATACYKMIHVDGATPVVEHSTDSESNDAEEVEAGALSVPTMTSAFQRVFRKSKIEWNHMIHHGNIPTAKFGSRKVHDVVIRDALAWLFRPQNVQLLSWGTRILTHRGGQTVFPIVIRRKCLEQLYKDYVAERSEHPLQDRLQPLGRTIFGNLVSTYTRGQQKRKGCVDYMLGGLVYDNIKLLAIIVGNEVGDSNVRRKLQMQLTAVQDFLKFGVMTHLGRDSDPLHDTTFALLRRTSEDDEHPRYSRCKYCMTPFQTLLDIAEAVDDVTSDVRAALDDARERFILFLGHQVRCHVQEKRIHNVFQEVVAGPEMTHAVVLLDFKMKFEPIFFREKSSEFFGKKGISWHGAVVFHMAARDDIENIEYISDMSSLATLYIDHIVGNQTTQDAVAVCSILEAVLHRAKTELPLLSEVWLLSDNASCYQNNMLPVIAPFIADAAGLNLRGILHSETQRGKSLVDAHFAVAMRHVNKYCNEQGLDVHTPSDLAGAIAHGDGIANTAVELIDIRPLSAAMQKWSGAGSAGMLQKLGRTNDIAYSRMGDNVVTALLSEYSGGAEIKWNFTMCKSSLADVVATSTTVADDGADSGADTDDDGRIHAANNGDVVEHAGVVAPTSVQRQDTLMTVVEAMPNSNPDEYMANMPGTQRYHKFVGPLTGVVVWSQSHIRRMKKRRSIRSATALPDAVEALDCDDSVVPPVAPSAGADMQARLTCFSCMRIFYDEITCKDHEATCQSHLGSMSVVNRAGPMAMRMLSNNDITIYRAGETNPVLDAIRVSAGVYQTVPLVALWATRPRRGLAHGRNFVHPFVPVITEWFFRGEHDKGKKMSPAMMVDELQRTHPRRYDLPSAHHVQTVIAGLIRRRTAPSATVGQSSASRGPSASRGRPSRIGAQFVAVLEELLAEDATIMPRTIRARVIHKMYGPGGSVPDEFPAEATLRAKFSTLKSIAKRGQTIEQTLAQRW